MKPQFVSFALVVAVLASLAALPSILAYADKGVQLSTGAIEVKEAMSRGQTYDLPPISVHNPGDELTKYRMSVETQSDFEQRADPAWFSFSPTEFTLVPGTSQEVVVEFAIPSDVEAGSYSTLIVASVAQQGQGGASVGAAAATRLDFTLQGGQGGLPLSASALSALLAAAGLVTLGWVFRRTLSIRIERRAMH